MWARGEPITEARFRLFLNKPLLGCKESTENATRPAVSSLLLKGMILQGDAFFNSDESLLEGSIEDEDEWEKTEEHTAQGTGPRGAVSVLDIMKAVIGVCEKYPQCKFKKFQECRGLEGRFWPH